MSPGQASLWTLWRLGPRCTAAAVHLTLSGPAYALIGGRFEKSRCSSGGALCNSVNGGQRGLFPSRAPGDVTVQTLAPNHARLVLDLERAPFSVAKTLFGWDSV
jgi:hypothetical protein